MMTARGYNQGAEQESKSIFLNLILRNVKQWPATSPNLTWEAGGHMFLRHGGRGAQE
jgi:hypothetical protein